MIHKKVIELYKKKVDWIKFTSERRAEEAEKMKQAILVKQQLIEEILSIKCRIDAARSFYNNITDERLISACIYEMNSLQDQYAHLLGEAKALGASRYACVYPSRFSGK